MFTCMTSASVVLLARFSILQSVLFQSPTHHTASITLPSHPIDHWLRCSLHLIIFAMAIKPTMWDIAKVVSWALKRGMECLCKFSATLPNSSHAKCYYWVSMYHTASVLTHSTTYLIPNMVAGTNITAEKSII